MALEETNGKGTAILPREKDHDDKKYEEKKHQWCFRYEGRPFHAATERVTILEIKKIVGQEPEVAIAEIVDGKQVERPNDYVVDLAKDCSFKRVPEFVRG